MGMWKRMTWPSRTRLLVGLVGVAGQLAVARTEAHEPDALHPALAAPRGEEGRDLRKVAHEGGVLQAKLGGAVLVPPRRAHLGGFSIMEGSAPNPRRASALHERRLL